MASARVLLALVLTCNALTFSSADISCHYLYNFEGMSSCVFFTKDTPSCTAYGDSKPGTCTAAGYPVCCAQADNHTIQSWHTESDACNEQFQGHNQVKCDSAAPLTGDKAVEPIHESKKEAANISCYYLYYEYGTSCVSFTKDSSDSCARYGDSKPGTCPAAGYPVCCATADSPGTFNPHRQSWHTESDACNGQFEGHDQVKCDSAAPLTGDKVADFWHLEVHLLAPTPCCDKKCELPLVKYFSTDAPHGFCGEACMDPKNFNIYHKFETNLTLATEDHPCSAQRTPDNTKLYRHYFSTVTEGLPGVLEVTLDLYSPEDMPDHSCCNTPLFGGINCVGKPKSVTISGTGPFCCPSSATETTPCAKEEAQYVHAETNNKKESANISCHYLYGDPTSRKSAQISCTLFENFGGPCPKTLEPDSCTAVGYPVCCARADDHNIQSWHNAKWGCNYNQVKCGSEALTGDKAILV